MKVKGHWPLGKWRNNPGVTARELRKLLKLIAEAPITANHLAELVQVSDRTVRRWLAGVDVPSAEKLNRMVEIAQTKKREAIRFIRIMQKKGGRYGI